MDSNTERPKWLTDEKIAQYREWLSKAEPYTEEEIMDIPFDGDMFAEYDMNRQLAYDAQTILKKYDLL